VTTKAELQRRIEEALSHLVGEESEARAALLGQRPRGKTLVEVFAAEARVGGGVVPSELTDEVLALTRSRRANAPVQSNPKHVRIEDREAIVAYHLEHPTCEVGGCGMPGAVHHLLPQGSPHMGPDIDENFTSLCAGHHLHGHPNGFHQLGPRRWFAEHMGRLSSETMAKILAIYQEKWLRDDARKKPHR